MSWGNTSPIASHNENNICLQITKNDLVMKNTIGENYVRFSKQKKIHFKIIKRNRMSKVYNAFQTYGKGMVMCA